MTIKPWR